MLTNEERDHYQSLWQTYINSDGFPSYCKVSAFKVEKGQMEVVFCRYNNHVKEILLPEECEADGLGGAGRSREEAEEMEDHRYLQKVENIKDYDLEQMADFDKKSIFVIQASSGGYDAGNYAKITINNVVVPIQKNEHDHHRGLHIVVMNPYTGKVEEAKAFDTFQSKVAFEFYVSKRFPKGSIIVAACKDDCVTKFCLKGMKWF